MLARAPLIGQPVDESKFPLLLADMPRDRIEDLLESLEIPPLELSRYIGEPDTERYAAWLEHVPSDKFKQYSEHIAENAVASIDLDASVVGSIQVNPKCDEVHLKQRTIGKPEGWVPRPIHAVHGRLAVFAGPEVYFATEGIKMSYNFRTVNLWPRVGKPSFVLTLTYGAGKNSDELSAWFKKAIADVGAHVLVAGDDCVCIIRYDDHIVSLELDLSQCDHTIRKPALSFEWIFLKSFGVSDYTLDILKANARATLVISATRRFMGTGFQASVRRGEERNTGGVDTTVGNTVIVMGAWAGVLSMLEVQNEAPKRDWAEGIQRGFSLYGLEAKVRVSSGRESDLGATWWPPSFLKGTWWYCHEEADWVWAPLLSRLIKVTKTMSDPRRTQRLPGEPKLPMEEALRRQWVAVAKGLLAYPLEPRLKRYFTWVAAAHPLADRIAASEEELTADWKPRAGADSSLTIRVVAQAAAWYGVEEEVVSGFLDHFCGLRVGDFSEHPFWGVMALVDYN